MLASQRDLFELPRDVAYLNSASYSPLPRAVRLAGEAGVASKSAPWRMDPAAALAEAEAVRAAAGGFVGAGADDIALVPSVAYGVATAAANVAVAAGHRVLVMAGEFPSQALAWTQLAERQGAVLEVVARPADGDWTAALLARVSGAGLAPVGLAALTPLHWTDGAVVDLAALVPVLRRQGAAVVVDATQAAGVLALDGLGVQAGALGVGELGADFVAFPTYKWLLGPYSLAFLYAAPWRQGGVALEQHGSNRVGGTAAYAGRIGPPVAGARCYDMGERLNPVALPMALAGMALLHGWGQAAVAARLRMVTDQLAAVAEAAGFEAVPPAMRVPHILGLRRPGGRDAAAVVEGLAARGVFVAERGGRLRVSPHVFCDEGDVARFGDGLAAVGRGA